MDLMDEMILEMRGICKSFPGVHALTDVHFDVRRGEVHALMGENGAGKSTLMKVLSGIYRKDAGTILFEGKEVEFHSPREALEAGIAIVHQELNLIGHLTVAQNLFIGREPVRGVMIRDNDMNAEARKLFARLGMDIDPKARMSSLTVAKQQMCEIAKAVSHNAKLIIFDEPTAALTEAEIEQLFALIRELRAGGCGLVYISHRMDEIKEITDRVTIMRDGRYIDTLITADSTKEEIISGMVGRVIYEDPKTESRCPSDAPVVLKVERLNAGKLVRDVSFELRKGQILGFAGLVGAGRTETLRALFGADPKQGGEIWIDGIKTEIRSPKDAVKAGISYLSEDRKRYGLMLQKGVAENTTMATLKQFLKGVFILKRKEKDAAEQYIGSLTIKTPGADEPVMNLSGGNQQKVVMAKWLLRDSSILIFDEPTRGIDVGAKQEIYELMNRLTEEGKSIIMISSELVEILRMSDRIIVMNEGRITGELDISDATQEKIMALATRRDGQKGGAA